MLLGGALQHGKRIGEKVNAPCSVPVLIALVGHDVGGHVDLH
jgi:hypothetical protein